MPGTYDATVAAGAGFVAEQVQVEVEAGITSDVTVTLWREALVTIQCVASSDAPLALPIRLTIEDQDASGDASVPPRRLELDGVATELRLAAGAYRFRADSSDGRVAFASLDLEDEHSVRRDVALRFR
jgi:hypothetical protein